MLKKYALNFFLTLVCVIVSSSAFSMDFRKLILRDDGLYYEKRKYTPFEGETSQGTLKGGAEHGFWREYFPNGQLQGKGFFHEGEKQGSWTTYNREGKKLSDGDFIEKIQKQNENFFCKYLGINCVNLLACPKTEEDWKEGLAKLLLRDDRFFKPFNDCPFTGWVRGQGRGNQLSVDGEELGNQVGRLEDGVQVGIWKTFFPPNIMKFLLNDPEFRIATAEIGSFLNGKKHGLWKYCGAESGRWTHQVILRERYKEGLKIYTDKRHGGDNCDDLQERN